MKTLLSQAERSRTEYNPLRGLTISRAVSLLEAGQRGEYADLMWTYEFVENTDADLLALVERRTSALVELDWNIKTVSEDTGGFSQQLADDQAGALREAYENIDNLYEAIEHLEMAVFRGFSAVQPRFAGPLPTHLECLDPWNFVRDGRYGDWYWNPTARNVSARALGEGSKLKPGEVLLHEVKRPIDRIGLIKFVRANLSEKDWDYWIETYGIPGVFVIMPDNVPADKQSEYLAAAEAAARGNSGALPGGSKVESNDKLSSGPGPFETRLKYLSEQLVLAGTGGKLTMLTESGSGTLAGGAHADTFEQIARADAAKISELFQRHIDKRILAARFPDRPALAYFDLAAEESQDIGEIIAHAKGLTESGLQVDPDDMAERTGYKITGLRAKNQEEAKTLPVKVTNQENPQPATFQPATLQPATLAPAEALRENTLALALQAERGDLADLAQGLYNALEALDLGDEPAYARALADLRASLPGQAQALLLQPQLSNVIADGLAAALANGWEENISTTDAHG